MMLDINFLTKEHSSKLFVNNMARVVIMVMFVVVLIVFGAYGGIRYVITQKENVIADLNSEIKDLKAKTSKVIADRKKIPDLTGSIAIITEVFEQKNLRVSTNLYKVQEAVPSNLFLTKLTYDKSGKIILEGKAGVNYSDRLATEKNVYQFEENLKQSGQYSTVSMKSLKIEKDEKTNRKEAKFKYELSLNMLIAQ